jgi:hypothetical protein
LKVRGEANLRASDWPGESPFRACLNATPRRGGPARVTRSYLAGLSITGEFRRKRRRNAVPADRTIPAPGAFYPARFRTTVGPMGKTSHDGSTIDADSVAASYEITIGQWTQIARRSSYATFPSDDTANERNVSMTP